MANSNGHGGVRKGQGRPAKADEQQLIERLTPLSNDAYKALSDSLKDGQGWAVKLFMEYMYGKPKQQIENTNINYNTQDLTEKEIELLRKDLDNKY